MSTPVTSPTKKTTTSKRKMKPGGGKKKGNGFEGVVSKTLTEKLQPLNFLRTPGSGARVGGKNFATIGAMFGEEALKIFVGDVVPVNEKQVGITFHHSVECKFYKTQDHITSLANGTSKVYAWMKEAEEDAKKINKHPMIIFKWNNTPIYVGTKIKGTESFSTKPVITVTDDKGEAIYIHLLEKLLQEKTFWMSDNLTEDKSGV